MVYLNDLKIFPVENDAQRSEAVNQMLNFSANNGVWPEVRVQKREENVYNGVDLRGDFHGTCRTRSSHC